jgi:ribulose-phosphate 3-epimerase
MNKPFTLTTGVKTDPIEYRFSYEWLFRLLMEEEVSHVQLGTFFEIYQLPDETFIELKKLALDYGIKIFSVFTAHRELGGFFIDDDAWQNVARKKLERLIEIGRLVGAYSVGSNPGATLRDKMELKPAGITCYMKHMKELMHYAKEHNVLRLGIEPMSCMAEPPTFPDEIHQMCEELLGYHRQNPDTTSTIGCCTDVSHGYADSDGVVRWDNMQLLKAALPYTTEIHLKNTNSMFNSTFGFTEPERQEGIVNVAEIRDMLIANSDIIPVSELVGYLEISGPKVGRDYSDWQLESQLRESLRYVKGTFVSNVPAI